ncbi:Chromosome fragility-associated [Hyphodiscus hymeniophilus]|uniref:Chromosome fragility-associated n=1 Tax=Hyphodiscus hymeniophilus TaxID=353542 RepID=A0A9P6VIW5_9HELO|nr:Chromosome fragility-associated [Hyphodiscus hymeniophilus]
MGQLNEDRRNVYPLFEKSSKAIKSMGSPAPSPQQMNDGTTDEITSKTTAGQGREKSENPAKDDITSIPSSNIALILPLQKKSDFLVEVDSNNHRRKRQKKAVTTNETTKIEDVIPRPQRQKAPMSYKEPLAFEVEDLMEKQDMGPPETRPGRQPNTRTQVEESITQPLLDNGGALLLETPSIGIPANKAPFLNTQDRSYGSKIPRDSLVGPKPQKILRFNPKTGTIGSPPAKKSAALIEAINKPRSNSRGKQVRSIIVAIRYGQGEASPSTIGLQIEQILNGTKGIEPPAKKERPSPKKEAISTSRTTDVLNNTALDRKGCTAATLIPTKPPGPIHPFFSGKPVGKSTNASDSTKEDANLTGFEPQEAVSLGRARLLSRGDRPPIPTNPRSSGFEGFQGFGSRAKVTKFPGAIEPAWPWKGMVHVRGNEVGQDGHVFMESCPEIQSKPKKSKYHAIEILAKEDVLVTITAELDVDEVLKSIQDLNLDDYPQLPGCLRTPSKYFESGYELQKRILKEVDARLPQPTIANDEESSEDEIQQRASKHVSTHPAISRSYTSIATSSTAFDQFRYETEPWTRKHSPRCAADVLQTGKEAMILKEWLQNLTVMSVDTGGSGRPNSRASSVSRLSAASKSDTSGKRKRKSKKLDGFVVSSDEENDDMNEISEPEDDASFRGSQSLFKKTVVRQGDVAGKGTKDSRLTNAILVSGPHGCGKTAAIYAVAKELGFEVFEINSSSRRSGKDILERVGDMTRNHLVQRAHDQAQLESLDEDAQRISDALADDIKTGRQGTMNSFFKTKNATKSKPKPKKPEPTAKTSTPIQASLAPRAPSKQQKQSLILFEEVDVLYEEDKQFWSTVISLITQSKRPIIMTCQDESLVPMQTLFLHAILRFVPPPIDVATDYMLLVAANEGHALQRDAVKALYQSRHLDLRASLTELNFWCQYAVGDVKGGLDWLCPRWPLGCDIDNHGNTIRVVSEKTYEIGMGWLSQDFLESHMHYLAIEEETLHEAKDGWNVDLGHWQNSIDMNGWANKTRASSTGRADDLARISIYDDFADAMSAADMFSGSAFAAENQVKLDFAVPDLSDKVREDYLSNLPIIEATPLLDFDNTCLDISLWIKSRAREYLQVKQHLKHGLEVPSELDRPSEAHIVNLIHEHVSEPEAIVTRKDLSLAFDPISEPEKPYVWSTGQLEASVFDRTQTIITTDLAPYVRSIVSYDAKLQQERSRMSSLLSEGGRKGKRMRTTRSAFSALEGGVRSTTRRDRYFGPNLNPYLVLKTGMPSWLDAVSADTSLNTVASTRFGTGVPSPSREESDVGDGD